MRKFFNAPLVWIAKHFSSDPSGMLITTGVIGWILSSMAQILAVQFNHRLDDKQKSFLIPQEMMDAAYNIGFFLLVTMAAKYGVSKLFKTGIIAPQKVRTFISKHPEEFAGKIGKWSFNMNNVKFDKCTKNSYKACKEFGTTVATIGAGILATNVLTPLCRNKTASRVHNHYVDYKKSNPYPINYSGSMKI